jgi:hypothetical protein
MFNADQVQKMVDAYVLGNSSLVKIGADFGVSVPTISKYLLTAGVELRGRGRPKGSKNVPKAKPSLVQLNKAVEVAAPDEIGTDAAEEVNYDPPEVAENDVNPEEPDVASSAPATPFRW